MLWRPILAAFVRGTEPGTGSRHRSTDGVKILCDAGHRPARRRRSGGTGGRRRPGARRGRQPRCRRRTSRTRRPGWPTTTTPGRGGSGPARVPPRPPPGDQVVGLHPARRCRGSFAAGWEGLGGVVEAQHLAGVDGGAERHEDVDGHPGLRPGRRPLGCGDLHGVDAVAQPCGHDLADGAQRADGGLADRGAGGGDHLQGHGERDGLLVVEQQRRQLRPGREPVPAVGPLGGLHGVAELAQPVDVAARRAGADAEPLGQQRPGPVPAHLQQGQQRQQPCRRSGHRPDDAEVEATTWPLPLPTWSGRRDRTTTEELPHDRQRCDPPELPRRRPCGA